MCIAKGRGKTTQAKIRAFAAGDLSAALHIWNGVAKEGTAFPQEELSAYNRGDYVQIRPCAPDLYAYEEQINNHKAFYYEALRQSSAGWQTNENSYIPFVENFLSSLGMYYKELDKRFAPVHGKKISKKARIEATLLNSLRPLSKADICKILPDASPTTVEAVLGRMVKDGAIQRIGAGRASRYIKL